jgi:hypothetical protein
VVHRVHRPPYRYIEYHHIVPRAWQAFWKPPGKAAVVWDPRTLACCRTSHGNIHDILVTLMHARAAGESGTARDLVGRHSPAEYGWACAAMERWEEWGGDINALLANGLYGEI